MPIAEISGARRNEPRSGRLAKRSIAQFSTEVKFIATISTMSSASATEVTPSQVVRMRSAISATKLDTMKTSP